MLSAPVVSVATSGAATISWSHVPGASSYNLYDNGTLKAAGVTSPWSGSGFTLGRHTIMVTSVVEGVENKSMPSPLTVSPTGYVVVTWTAVTGASSYNYYLNGSLVTNGVTSGMSVSPFSFSGGVVGITAVDGSMEGPMGTAIVTFASTTGGTYTAQDIINAALRKIGVLAKSEAATDDELNDSLQALNFMIDSWSSRRLLITAEMEETFPLVANKGDYTIGATGADFTSDAPIKIVSAYYRDSFGLDRILSVINKSEYDSQEDKAFVSAPPEVLYYDQGNTQQATRKGTIRLYNRPDDSDTYTLHITSQKYFTEFGSLTAGVTFPPAYYEALVWNLAMSIYPEFHGPKASIPALISGKAADTIEELESVNARKIVSGIDVAGKSGGFNWISGDING